MNKNPVLHRCLSLLLIGAALLGASCGGRKLLCQMPEPGDVRPLLIKARAATLRFDPPRHELELIDSVWFSGTLQHFELNAGMELEELRLGDRRVPLKRLEISAPDDPADPLARAKYGLTCRSDAGLAVFSARGRLWQDPGQVRFGHETVGGELVASIGEEGLWLSAASAVLPDFGLEELCPHRVHAELPEDFRVVTQGRLLRDETAGGLRRMTWDEPLPAEAPSIAGGRYDLRREDCAGVEVSTWFFKRDPGDPPLSGPFGPVDDGKVRDTLHEMCRYYLEMYGELIGPYPYGKFAVVESFFPSGYGMPSWTLLDRQVIRMPFIPYTSLGHELLHNYWGNGVFVDDARGNWCEGLTVYGADYRYKLLEDADKVRDYRKDQLKTYRNYVHEGNDLPLSAFRDRHDGATRALGYGKAMMVLHMIRGIVGEVNFDAALRDFFREHLGRAASWTDLLKAFERRGQVELERFGRQWIDGTGAPLLRLRDVAWSEGRLSGSVVQDRLSSEALGDRIFELDLLLRVECHDGSVLNERLFMEKERLEFHLDCPEPRRVLLDPDFDLFRLLDDREIEPIISLCLAEERPLFVVPGSWLRDPQRKEALLAFARRLRDLEDPELAAWKDFDPQTLERRSVILVNPPRLPGGIEFVDLRHSREGWQLMGHSGSWEEGNLVLATRAAGNPSAGALLFFASSPESLPFLARKVPHYGKYSYLEFDNEGLYRLKGNLPPRGNPLEVRFGGF